MNALLHHPSLFDDLCEVAADPIPLASSNPTSMKTDPFEPISEHAKMLAARAVTENATLVERRLKATGSEKSNLAGVRGIQDGRSGVPRVNPFKLKAKPGFNCRLFDLPEQIEADRIMTESIKIRGVLEAIEVEIGEDNITLWVVDGESRLRNTIRAINDGAKIENVPVKVVAPGLDDAELVARQLVHNNQRRNFSPLEIATNVKKLLGYGWDAAKIERETGVSVARQKDALETASLPVEAKNLITSGKVSASLARDQIEKAETKAEGVRQLKEAVKVAASHGRSRALPRDVAGSTTPTSDRSFFAGVFRSAEASRDTDGRTTVVFEEGVYEDIRRRLGL